MINPNKHIGEQITKARETKGITAEEARKAYNKLFPQQTVNTVQSYFQKERRADIGVVETVRMCLALGIPDIYIADLKTEDDD